MYLTRLPELALLASMAIANPANFLPPHVCDQVKNHHAKFFKVKQPLTFNVKQPLDISNRNNPLHGILRKNVHHTSYVWHTAWAPVVNT